MDEKFFAIPTMILRRVVVFPEMNVSFDLDDERAIASIDRIIKSDRKLFLITQKDSSKSIPKKISDLYEVGVIVEVRQVLKYPGESVRVLVQGIRRARLTSICFDGDCDTSDVEALPNVDEIDQTDDTNRNRAIVKLLNNLCEQYCQVTPQNLPSHVVDSLVEGDDPEQLFKDAVFNIPLNTEDKQALLESNNTFDRLSRLYDMLSEQLEVLALQKDIHDEVKRNMDNNQRDYYLREQLKVLTKRLGEDEENDAEEYRNKIDEKVKPYVEDSEVIEKLYDEADKLAKLPSASQEAYVVRNYLDTVLKLPWRLEPKKYDFHTALKYARAVLDRDHYGLEKVKERILETLAIQILAPKQNGNIICLSGPPGVGKTSICKSIAEAMGREYVRVSLGGVRDEADIRGHRKTYIGAMPGRIINAMIHAKVKNPIILLDEVDKMSNDFRGDPSSALLEVLDKEQNVNFVDHYVEVPYDLSDVMFITTANDSTKIPAPLLDRMELIELPSYTREEKFHIAREHLAIKQIRQSGLSSSQVKFTEGAIYGLIDHYTKEAGVRTLERNIATLCRKTAKEVVEGRHKKLEFDANNLEEYLGAKKYTDDSSMEADEVGVVNGLAWTSVGGVLMPIETIALKGTGKVQTTGSLGEVMKESSSIAVSYVRSIADRYSIPEDFYQTMDLHIHAPEGAVPKDGPSAGVTMVTSIVSTLANIPVRHDVAMTGEITLHGKVLPIGGLREKTMAGYKSGIKTIIIPKGNASDLSEIDPVVKESINFVLAETLDDVLSHALAPKLKLC